MDIGAKGDTFSTDFTNVEKNLMYITYSISTSHLENTREFRPIGFCLDVGAPRSVLGRLELDRIVKATGIIATTTHNSPNSFRFELLPIRKRRVRIPGHRRAATLDAEERRENLHTA